MFNVLCPSCGAGLDVFDDMMGHWIQCGRCSTSFAAMTENAPPAIPEPFPEEKPSSRLGLAAVCVAAGICAIVGLGIFVAGDARPIDTRSASDVHGFVGDQLAGFGEAPAHGASRHAHPAVFDQSSGVLAPALQVAWKKLRRSKPQPSVQMAGYLLPNRRWMLRSYDRHHLPYWAYGHPIDYQREESSELTRFRVRQARCEQNLAFYQGRLKEIRSRVGDLGRDQPNVLQDIQKLEGVIRPLLAELDAIHAERSQLARPYLSPDQVAEIAATAAVQDPAVMAVVIVDLFGQESPLPVFWYYDDGGGARKYAEAPSATLGDSLRHYLFDELVRHADILE